MQSKISQEPAFSSLLETLYTAASGKCSWQEYLSSLAEYFGCHQALMLTADKQQLPNGFVDAFGLDMALVELWNGDKEHIDHWYIGCARQNKAISYCGEELTSTNVLRESEFYNDILRPMNIETTLGSIVPEGPLRRWVCAVYKQSSHVGFSRQDKLKMDSINRHYAKAIEFSQLLAHNEHLLKVQHRLLDHLPYGALLVSPQGQVLDMNQQGQDTAAQADGLKIVAGKLSFSNQAAQRRYVAVLFRASKQETISDNQMINFAVERVAPQDSLEVTLFPLNVLQNDLGHWNNACCLVLLIDPNRPPEVPHESLVSRFGLTISEAKLAVLLLRNTSLRGAAEEMGKAPNTLKTQLRGVYRKLGVTNRTEMVRRLIISGNQIVS